MIRNGAGISNLRQAKLPFIVWVVVMSTFIACIGGKGILGYQISAVGWVVPLAVSLLMLLQKSAGIKFPILIWLPWIFLVIIYVIAAKAPNALQRSVMLLCPFIVGMAVSRFTIKEEELQVFKQLYQYLAIALCIVVGLKSGLLITGVLPKVTGLAAEVMVATLLCSLFASRYGLGEKKALTWWWALAGVPFIALTRIGIVAAGLTLPLTFTPLNRFKRILILVLIGTIELGIFYMPRTQEKMFYSGRGTLAELKLDNPDFATSGRSYMWDMMKPQIENEPLLGHGANASEVFVSVLTGGLAHPHNDWLRLLFDYGYLGTFIFAFCLLWQFLHAVKRAKSTTGETRLLFYAGASSFLIFVLFMFTDNIILYAAFFGNLQFTILGLAYAAYGASPEGSDAKMAFKRRLRIRW
jgi:O-antigen ligase